MGSLSLGRGNFDISLKAAQQPRLGGRVRVNEEGGQ